MNWAPYAVYNPQLWHWPETWPLVSLSPTVEPFIVVGYATFYFGAVLPRGVDPAAHPGAAAGRRRSCGGTRSISLAVLIFVIGFVFDAMLEIFLVRTQLYIYSQVIPFGSIFAGEVVPVPADLGVGARHAGDDPGRRAAVPRRHRPHAGREARPARPAVPRAARRSARSS